MHTEKQFFQNRYAQGVQWLCAGMAAVQLAWLAAAEAGLAQLPMSGAAHGCILLVAGLGFGLLAQAALVLRVEARGMSLRYFPYQWRFQHIGWDEVRQLRLLPPGEYPVGAPFGLPGRDFTHAYWLSTPRYRVLHITLVNGTQVYVSTERPRELLDFLQRGLYLKHLLPKHEYPISNKECPMSK